MICFLMYTKLVSGSRMAEKTNSADNLTAHIYYWNHIHFRRIMCDTTNIMTTIYFVHSQKRRDKKPGADKTCHPKEWLQMHEYLLGNQPIYTISLESRSSLMEMTQAVWKYLSMHT